MGKSDKSTLEKIRDELIVISQKVKKGELTPTVGNAVVNALRSSAYVEQVRIQQEKGLEIKLAQSGAMDLSEADKIRMDKIIALLESDT